MTNQEILTLVENFFSVFEIKNALILSAVLTAKGGYFIELVEEDVCLYCKKCSKNKDFDFGWWTPKKSRIKVCQHIKPEGP
jgi:hypothetical protein